MTKTLTSGLRKICFGWALSFCSWLVGLILQVWSLICRFLSEWFVSDGWISCLFVLPVFGVLCWCILVLLDGVVVLFSVLEEVGFMRLYLFSFLGGLGVGEA